MGSSPIFPVIKNKGKTMKTLVNRETLICDECGTDLLIHKNGEILCNLCEDQRILKSNQIL